jgi:membrane protease YdiL (CAAX protease family)
LNGDSLGSAPLVVEPFPAPDPQPALPAPSSSENPVFSGWDVLKIAGLTVLLAIFVVPALMVSAARFFVYQHQPWLDVAQKPALALLSQFVSYIVVALFMVLLIEGRYHTSFWRAIRWNWPGIAGLNLLGLGVLMLGFDYLAKFLPMPKNTPFDLFFDRPLDAYLTAIFAVTAGPLMEELFFRGMLYPVLARRLGALPGIFFTALLFGLMHFAQYGRSWGAVLIIFLVGVVLTAIRAITKSVASSFLAHVGYNGTLMILAAVATDGFRHMEKAAVVLALCSK